MGELILLLYLIVVIIKTLRILLDIIKVLTVLIGIDFVYEGEFTYNL
jgi:hypothetical protein